MMMILILIIIIIKIKVYGDRPSWPKGFRVD